MISWNSCILQKVENKIFFSKYKSWQGGEAMNTDEKNKRAYWAASYILFKDDYKYAPKRLIRKHFKDAISSS